jgi:AcrR family transcriptional regulator
VQAAIAIADADGFDAISMRRIAAQLGVGTMSLYWYVTNKDELLDLVYDEIFGEIEQPLIASGDWRNDAEQLAHATRNVLLRHPWLVSVAGNQPALGPNLLRHIESALAIFEPLGLSSVEMLSIMSAIDISITGFVVHELRHKSLYQQHDMTEDEMFAWLEPYLEAQLATGQYPIFRRVIESMHEELDAEAQFKFGLDCLLDGIAARIAAAQRAQGGIAQTS